MKRVFPFFSRFFRFIWKWFPILGSAATLLGCWIVLEFSCILCREDIWSYRYYFLPQNFILSYLTLGVLWSLFLILCRRMWLASLLCSVLCGGVAIANHYVITFHGMPLSFLLIKNFSTAMNVISGYDFPIDFFVGMLIFGTAVLILLSLIMRKTEIARGSRPRRAVITRDLILLILSGCVLFFGYFGPNPIKPKKTIAWLWTEAYNSYGYLPCSIETLCQLFNSVSKPEGYSAEKVSQIQINEPSVAEYQTPDIFLILNESFYDLRQITDFETDVPYQAAIDGLLTGYAVTPNAGGSTNVSEYELLSSNSTYLMPGVTPFNTLDLRNANSIVSYLLAQGYDTLACHPASSSNYSRGFAYPHLGFQNSYFLEDLSCLEAYGDREHHKTDSSVYANLIRLYEEAPDNQPHFYYTLTIQNHGDWKRNAPEEDLVHVTDGSFGEDTEMINEYLSCISLSYTAFQELTEYFSQQDRPVIICMTGDHAPSFASSVADPQLSAEEKALELRKVPLLIWANFALPEIDLGTMSMNFVVPTLLDLAGVELSPYYRYMLQLKEQVPIVSSYGSYYDAEGNQYQYSTDDGMPYASAVDNYFYLEYQNLQDDRDHTLFQPAP